jgi:hypothetical protein
LLSSHGPFTLQPLPDLSSWRYVGRTTLKSSVPVNMWQLSEKHEDKVASYTFYTHVESGAPVRLAMMGYNIVQYSHFGGWVVHTTGCV